MITYLKIIVIVLGILIAAGIVVIGLKLADGTRELVETNQPEDVTPDDATKPTSVLTLDPLLLDLGLPKGSAVRQMVTSERRLVLDIRVPNSSGRVIIIDLQSGALVSDISLGTKR